MAEEKKIVCMVTSLQKKSENHCCFGLKNSIAAGNAGLSAF